MDNDTYDDRHSTQQTFNKNIVKRIQELEDKRPSKLDDQVDIKLMKQDEWSEHINQLLEGIDTILEENEKMTNSLDIAGRLNRSNHKRLREEFEEFKESTVTRLDQEIENRTKAFNKIDQIEEDLDIIDITLERHADILVVHRNQLDNKGEHGKEE